MLASIENSNYMVSKLRIWNEPGRKDLRKFLANLSVPLEQASQKFSFMDPSLKSTLKDNILKVAHQFSLDEPIMHGYVRQFDS